MSQPSPDHPTSPITALIPAAGRVSEGVMALSNVTCPALIPIAGRPVVYWTLSYLAELGIRRAIVGLREPNEFLEELLHLTFHDTVEVDCVVLEDTRSVGDTVGQLADRAEGGPLLVVLGDTSFSFTDPGVLSDSRPFVLTSKVNESFRWCVAETSTDGTVLAFRDKEPGLRPPLDGLIGVYFFPTASSLREAYGRAASAVPDRRLEMSTLLDALDDRARLLAIPAETWLDCGNPDTQVEAQRQMLGARAFNDLTVDRLRGTVTKRSHAAETLIDEINYLRLLPPDIAPLFPRLLDFSTEWEDPYLTLEFYGYPTLAELFVFENADVSLWRKIFRHLLELVRTGLGAHQRPISEADCRAMYVDKTYERLASPRLHAELRSLLALERFTLNGVEMVSPTGLRPLLEPQVAKMSNGVLGAVVHGDLCFSNVLYDLRSGVCKLIDPRGSFGRPGIYGDPRYDIAKLFHSVHGLYDFIVADLFRLDVDVTSAQCTLAVMHRTRHRAIAEEFERVFFPPFDRREVLLLTGLLFLSMAPLHYDDERRQAALCLRGVQLVNEALDLAPALP